MSRVVGVETGFFQNLPLSRCQPLAKVDHSMAKLSRGLDPTIANTVMEGQQSILFSKSVHYLVVSDVV